jgi:hypothetical protein
VHDTSSVRYSSVHPLETKLPSRTLHLSHPLPSPDNRFATEESRGAALAMTFRHSGWASDRQRVFDALHRTQQTHARREAFAYCGAHAFVLKSTDDPPRYKLAGSGCHDRFCLPCGQARASQIARNIIDYAAKKRLRLITLTTGATYPTLADLLDHLYTSFRKLQRTAEWRTHVTGGVAFLELKVSSRTDRWHPHIHAIVEGKYFPHDLLKAAWHRVTGEARIVDIRPAGKGDRLFHYVTKYASKPMDPSFLRLPDRLDEAVTALKGRRTCMTWGAWRALLLTDHDEEAGWENIGELATWLLLAESGDEEALAVCSRIDVAATTAAVPTPRPPPPEPVPVAQPATGKQALLFDVFPCWA